MDDDVNTAHVVRSGNKVGVSSKQKRDGIVYTYILSCCAATVAESGMNVARRMPQFVLLFNFDFVELPLPAMPSPANGMQMIMIMHCSSADCSAMHCSCCSGRVGSAAQAAPSPRAQAQGRPVPGPVTARHESNHTRMGIIQSPQSNQSIHRLTAAVAEWLACRTHWSCWRHGEREVVSSNPDRGTI